MKLKIRKLIKKSAVITGILLILSVLFVFSVNIYVKNSQSSQILSIENCQNIKGADCILILGCGVTGDGKPSAMLEDRLKRGIELYNSGCAPKILMSGDHGRDNYDEVNVMKDYAVSNGVPSEDVFMDHAGFSTYESIYRAKNIFQVKKIIVVTQEYHLYRALYIADKFGMEAYGSPSDLRSYGGQSAREVREILARNKDMLLCIFKPESTYTGEVIPVTGNGNITNDK